MLDRSTPLHGVLALFDCSVGSSLSGLTTCYVILNTVAIYKFEALLMVFESREGKCAIHARFLKLSDIDVTLLSIEHSFKGPVLIIRNVFKYELGSPIRRSNDRAWRYTSLTFLASG